MEKKEEFWATGRRKTSSARVRLIYPGEGKIIINKRDYKDYFGGLLLTLDEFIKLPLIVVNKLNEFDVYVNVRGGGVVGQAGAIRLGIARALLKYNQDLRSILKKYGLLTRDPRKHERKKYGLYGRRRAFQWTKR